jgi:hypothetical protein
VTGSLYSIVAREYGGGGRVRRGRTRGPNKRPPFTAHIAAFWSPVTVADHVAGCRSGRDANGQWRPWHELDQNERWCFWWEALEGYAAFAPTAEISVP